MDSSTGFLIYAALYRLTVLAVGAMSIWLGFRLFNQAGSKFYDSAGDGGSASAEGGGFKLTLTNILPGTYFALFGTVIIGIMLWQGPPQLNLKNISEATNSELKSASTADVRKSEGINLDGGTAIDQEWKKLDKPGLTLAEASDPLSNIARIWQQEKRIGEALAMAKLAARYEGSKASHLALFAELLLENGETKQAVKVMQLAVERDPSYNMALNNMQQLINRSGTKEKAE